MDVGFGVGQTLPDYSWGNGSYILIKSAKALITAHGNGVRYNDIAGQEAVSLSGTFMYTVMMQKGKNVHFFDDIQKKTWGPIEENGEA